MSWPTPEAIAAVTSPIPYDSPGPWDGGAHCAGSHLPGTGRLADYLRTFPGVSRVGGYSCRANTANAREMSVHGTGRALDIMLPDPAYGDDIANWLVANANVLGVQLVIWDRVIWNSERRTTRPYTGPSSHTDHIHVELTRAAANGPMDALPAFGAEETGARSGGVVLLLAVAAGVWALWPRKKRSRVR